MTVLVVRTSRGGAGAAAVRAATDLLGRHPGPLHHRCPGCGSLEHGAPSFDAPVAVSIAHAPGLSLVAVSTAGPVGVDLEPVGAADRQWVEEEAIGKARGTGLTDRPQDRAGVVLAGLELAGYVSAVAVLGSDVPVVAMLPVSPQQADPGAPLPPTTP